MTTPTEPIGLAVHSMPAAEQLLADRRTRSGRLRMLLVLAICAAPVIASYFAFFVVRPAGQTNYAELIHPTRTMPDTLPLQGLDGAAVAPGSLRRQWLLVSVGTAACDAACEQRLYMQRQLHKMLGRDRNRLDRVWFVLDGGTPRAELLAALNADPDPIRILRVPPEALGAWLQPAAGQAIDQHLYVVDPMGEWMMRAPVQADPMRLKRDLERLQRASASWQTGTR